MNNYLYLKSVILLSILIISITSIAIGATGNIEGNVKDAQTGKPLPSVNVIIIGTSMGAASDGNGNFSIKNVPVGTYKIQASYIDYKSNE